MMKTLLEHVVTVPVRIRFSGTVEAETFHLLPKEWTRFYADWKSYLAGMGAMGGEYAFEESDRPMVTSLNFSHIAYIEPGKIY